MYKWACYVNQNSPDELLLKIGSEAGRVSVLIETKVGFEMSILEAEYLICQLRSAINEAK